MILSDPLKHDPLNIQQLTLYTQASIVFVIPGKVSQEMPRALLSSFRAPRPRLEHLVQHQASTAESQFHSLLHLSS